jgi:hypothetical protein
MKFSKNNSIKLLILFFVVVILALFWRNYNMNINKLHEGASSGCYENSPCSSAFKNFVYRSCNASNKTTKKCIQTGGKWQWV